MPSQMPRDARHFFMTAGEVSDCIAAAALPRGPPKPEWLLADRGHDADWLRDALRDKE